jgi:hypothetical protein
MGFYDCRCMVTGVSLKGADASLVLLQATGSMHSPIALAIKGAYNRLGAIDMIEEDVNTRLVLEFFLGELRSGRFAIEEEYLRARGYYPFRSIEALLQAFERNINDNSHAAVLDGQPVVFALISRVIWDTIARASPLPRQRVQTALRKSFEANAVAERIYSDSSDALSEHVRELAAVRALLADHRITWAPPSNPAQDYTDDTRQYLAEARRSFADSPVILAGLHEYEREVADLLQGD